MTTTDLLRRAAQAMLDASDDAPSDQQYRELRSLHVSLLALADQMERAEPVACSCELGEGHSVELRDSHSPLYLHPAPEVTRDAEPAYIACWNHGCNALCTEIDLWVNRCPHCGRPAPQAAMQEPQP